MEQDKFSLLDNAITTDPVPETALATTNNDLSDTEPARFPQHFAAFAATFSALMAGTVLGWTSPVLDVLQAGKYNNVTLSNDQIGWIGSFATLGAMFVCVPIGFVCDSIGRQRTLSCLFVPFLAGWSLIYFATDVYMLYVGRLILGLGSGGSCVAAPLYTSETAHKSQRGALGSYFQLMVTLGIFLAYVFGKFLSVKAYTLTCACLPLFYLVLIVFQPESPVYHLKKGEFDKAKVCLERLRGSSYDFETELVETENEIKENENVVFTVKDVLLKRNVRLGFCIAAFLMVFQQLSGVNVFILYTSDVFKGSGLDPKTATILVGGFQVSATFLASIVIDRSGRKVLLLISTVVVTVSVTVLSTYFVLKDASDKFGYVSVVALCSFFVAYSLGLGPVPWVVSSEIFPIEVKSVLSSVAGTLNWFLAFVLTKFYLQASESFGEAGVFYCFAAVSLVGVFFVRFVVVETKGKSSGEIQCLLGG